MLSERERESEREKDVVKLNEMLPVRCGKPLKMDKIFEMS